MGKKGLSRNIEPRYRRDPAIPTQEIEGQAVIVFPKRRELHELDEVGTLVWRSLEKSCSIKDLARVVCAEFDVIPAKAEKDLRVFLSVLEEKGLISRT